MKMNLLITLCARGGSKGVPGKNIKEIAGKPLLAYSIQTAQRFAEKHGADIILSTDGEDIKAVGREYGLDTAYERPPATATDKAGKIGAIAHAKEYMEATHAKSYDFVLDMDVTSPLRTVEDLEQALSLLQQDVQALNIFSVSKPGRNPYFNMVEQKDNGYYGVVKPLDSSVMSRQAAPMVYDMNASFYIYRKAFFDEGHTGAITGRSLIYEVSHLCFDIDEPLDFEIMGYLLQNNKLDFML